jgi:hypothetical protein
LELEYLLLLPLGFVLVKAGIVAAQQSAFAISNTCTPDQVRDIN